MNPRDFLDTAARLLLHSHESDFRSCISRAYYAVYQMLRIALLQNLTLIALQNSGLGDKNHISHDKLITVLKRSVEPSLAKFGEHLMELKIARTRADYLLERPVSRANAQIQYENAVLLRDELNAFGLEKLAKIVQSEIDVAFKKSP